MSWLTCYSSAADRRAPVPPRGVNREFDLYFDDFFGSDSSVIDVPELRRFVIAHLFAAGLADDVEPHGLRGAPKHLRQLPQAEAGMTRTTSWRGQSVLSS